MACNWTSWSNLKIKFVFNLVLPRVFLYGDFRVVFRVIFVHRFFEPNSRNFLRSFVARTLVNIFGSIPLQISCELVRILRFPQIVFLEGAFSSSLDSSWIFNLFANFFVDLLALVVVLLQFKLYSDP